MAWGAVSPGTLPGIGPGGPAPAPCRTRPAGTFLLTAGFACAPGAEGRAGRSLWRRAMHGLIYLIGLIVVIMAILSFFGLR
jgi:hypothetical protein